MAFRDFDFYFSVNSEEVNTIKTHVQMKHLQTESLEKKFEENVSSLSKPFISQTNISRKLPYVLRC